MAGTPAILPVVRTVRAHASVLKLPRLAPLAALVQIWPLLGPRHPRWPAPLRRLALWLRVAYEDSTSREHATLLEWLLGLVVLSVVLTIVEQDSALAGPYQWAFNLVDACVAAGLVADVVLHLLFAKQRRQYVFSSDIVIDVLAILPSLHLLVNTHAVKMLRGVRLIRVLRAVKLASAIRHRPLADDDYVPERTALPVEVAVVCLAPLLLLVPSDPLRNLLLVCLLVGALSIGLQVALVRRQRDGLAVAVLALTIVAGAVGSVALDRLLSSDAAVILALISVSLAAVSWFRIEAPHRAI